MKTNQDLKQLLKENGSSLRQFSIAKGYNYRTVLIVAQRWWYRADKQPHGGIARKIMLELTEYVHNINKSELN